MHDFGVVPWPGVDFDVHKKVKSEEGQKVYDTNILAPAFENWIPCQTHLPPNFPHTPALSPIWTQISVSVVRYLRL